MPGRVRMLCNNRSDRYDAHEPITHIGGRNPDGTAWNLTQRGSSRGIKNGPWEFNVNRGDGVRILIATSL